MPRRTYVDGPFGQLHARVAGEPGRKPALVCFHLSPHSGRMYERFLDRIAENDRHAIAFDTPGFGMSDTPSTLPSIADYAEAMRAGIEALGISRPVDLMGYHTGSMIAAQLAAERPAMVRRIVMIAAPIFTEEERAALRQHYGPVEPALDGSHLVKRWQSFVHHFLGRGLSLAHVADMFPEGLLGRSRSWWGHNAAFSFAPDMRLPELSQPLLVLNPDDDLQAETRRAAALLTNGRIVELPGWGHGFLDSETGKAAALIESFLSAPDDAPFGRLTLPSDG